MERQRIGLVSDTGESAFGAGEPLVYTVREAAGRLKVSPGTIRNMIAEGELYGIRLHVRRIVVPRWAVEELVARPRASTADEGPR